VLVVVRTSIRYDPLFSQGGTQTVAITPLTPVFAGEVGGDRPASVHDRCRWRAIPPRLDNYAVLVFRDQNFTNEEQLDFAQRFDGTAAGPYFLLGLGSKPVRQRGPG